MQAPQQDDKISHTSSNPLRKLPLDPFYANRRDNHVFDNPFYCQRHNMILGCCHFDHTLAFYDPTTIRPLKGREFLRFDGVVRCIVYYEETDTFLMGCDSGSIYSYNVGSGVLKRLRKCDYIFEKLAFVNSRFYAYKAGGLFIASLEDGNVYKMELGKNNCIAMKCLPEKNLFLIGLGSGSLRIYRADKLPHQQSFCSVQAFTSSKEWLSRVDCVNIKGKEYIVIAGNQGTMKVWHLVKGRMRLLRVFSTGKSLNSLICLENYKMIAIVPYRSNKIEFWDFFSGRLVKTFVCEKTSTIVDLYLLKDKNMIGAIGVDARNRIESAEFIQLHPREEESSL